MLMVRILRGRQGESERGKERGREREKEGGRKGERERERETKFTSNLLGKVLSHDNHYLAS